MSGTPLTIEIYPFPVNLIKKIFDLAIIAPPKPKSNAVGAVRTNKRRTVPTE
jgi:hypothetical protein